MAPDPDHSSLGDFARRLGAFPAAEEQGLAAIIAHTPNVAIEAYDREGRVLWWNPAAERIFGWRAEDAVGKTLDQLILDAPATAEFVAALAAVDRDGRPIGPSEWRFRRPDGTEGVVLSTIFSIPDAGGGKVFICMDVDVTEQKKAEAALREREEELRQAQKMEAIGRLAGGMAHDFNNMLFAIQGHADFLARALPPGDRRHRHALEIRKAAERAAGLTRQLLAFSRRQVLQPKILDLNAVVAEVEPLLRRLLGEDIEIEVRLAPDLGRTRADPVQVEQVIMNLCVNARDAMPRGGRIVVATANVRRRACDEVMLEVHDTGEGMTADVRAHIFEPFFTTKGPGKGTGLGLSTVYGIIRQSGGDIEVESAPGAGTTFRIYLPRVEEQAPGDAPAPPAGEGGARARGDETVLLVEDEEVVRRLMRDTLEAHGYRVIEAANGAEALAIRRQCGGHLDIVVTDVVMPQMGGLELVRRLRSEEPDLKVLFISGYPGETVLAQKQKEEAENGSPYILEKPFGGAQLLRCLREALDHAAPRGAPR